MQRSHGGHPVFRGDEDFDAYRRALAELAPLHGVAIHAYALLPTQVQLLATPTASSSLSRLWQALGRRFGADYNRRHDRSGVLWEGRFRTTVVDAGTHLLDCCRHVEWAPVRAGLADTPSDYPWSSAAHHLGMRTDAVITEHPRYWVLGNTPFEREAGYRRLLEQPLPVAIEQRLGDAVMKGWALGDAAFVRALGDLTERRVEPLPRGRPRGSGASKTVPK
jgi:putative transposase